MPTFRREGANGKCTFAGAVVDGPGAVLRERVQPDCEPPSHLRLQDQALLAALMQKKGARARTDASRPSVHPSR